MSAKELCLHECMSAQASTQSDCTNIQRSRGSEEEDSVTVV